MEFQSMHFCHLTHYREESGGDADIRPKTGRYAGDGHQGTFDFAKVRLLVKREDLCCRVYERQIKIDPAIILDYILVLSKGTDNR